MKFSKYIRINILITVLYIFLLIIGIIGIFAYKVPKAEDIKTTTGIIFEFKQRDGKWYDVIFGGATDKYFNITLNDDTFYEATGIYYDNIDRTLFELISNGDEITIRYINNGWSAPNTIISITYKDVCYLEVNDVLEDFEENELIAKAISPVFIVIITIATGVLYYLNYRTNKRGKNIAIRKWYIYMKNNKLSKEDIKSIIRVIIIGLLGVALSVLFIWLYIKYYNTYITILTGVISLTYMMVSVIIISKKDLIFEKIKQQFYFRLFTQLSFLLFWYLLNISLF